MYTYKGKLWSSNELLKTLLNDGILNDEIVEESNDWTTINSTTHEPYDFDVFIQKAKEYSAKSPPDVVQFSEKAWAAAAICVNEFYLKNFGILVSSHGAKSKLLALICSVLSGESATFVMSTWIDAEKSHSNFYGMKYLPKKEREALIVSIEKMAEIIGKVDVRLVEKKLAGFNLVKFHSVKEKKFKIGTKPPYSYTRIAF